MAVPALAGDLLPLGRHHVTLDEVKAAFVDDALYAGSRSRQVIWEHFERANALLRSAVEVHAVWIGGSFTTSKQNPRDIDVLYVLNAEDRTSRPAPERRLIDAFERRVRDPLTGRLVPEHGLLVDSYLLNWAPHFGQRSASVDYQRYAGDRGYWDDWWARQRTGTKSSAPTRADALPVRGYLEVQFSAYL